MHIPVRLFCVFRPEITGAHTEALFEGNGKVVDIGKTQQGGKLTPSGMITHIGGLDATAEATLNLPKIPGGKKLIYTQIDLPLAAISDFEELGKTDPMFAELDRMCKANNGLWNPEAEKFLLANAKSID